MIEEIKIPAAFEKSQPIESEQAVAVERVKSSSDWNPLTKILFRFAFAYQNAREVCERSKIATRSETSLFRNDRMYSAI